MVLLYAALSPLLLGTLALLLPLPPSSAGTCTDDCPLGPMPTAKQIAALSGTCYETECSRDSWKSMRDRDGGDESCFKTAMFATCHNDLCHGDDTLIDKGSVNPTYTSLKNSYIDTCQNWTRLNGTSVPRFKCSDPSGTYRDCWPGSLLTSGEEELDTQRYQTVIAGEELCTSKRSMCTPDWSATLCKSAVSLEGARLLWGQTLSVRQKLLKSVLKAYVNYSATPWEPVYQLNCDRSTLFGDQTGETNNKNEPASLAWWVQNKADQVCKDKDGKWVDCATDGASRMPICGIGYTFCDPEWNTLCYGDGTFLGDQQDVSATPGHLGELRYGRFEECSDTRTVIVDGKEWSEKDATVVYGVPHCSNARSACSPDWSTLCKSGAYDKATVLSTSTQGNDLREQLLKIKFPDGSVENRNLTTAESMCNNATLPKIKYNTTDGEQEISQAEFIKIVASQICTKFGDTICDADIDYDTMCRGGTFSPANAKSDLSKTAYEKGLLSYGNFDTCGAKLAINSTTLSEATITAIYGDDLCTSGESVCSMNWSSVCQSGHFDNSQLKGENGPIVRQNLMQLEWKIDGNFNLSTLGQSHSGNVKYTTVKGYIKYVVGPDVCGGLGWTVADPEKNWNLLCRDGGVFDSSASSDEAIYRKQLAPFIDNVEDCSSDLVVFTADLDEDGYISSIEMSKYLISAFMKLYAYSKEKASVEAASNLDGFLNDADNNKNGVVSYAEFKTWRSAKKTDSAPKEKFPTDVRSMTQKGMAVVYGRKLCRAGNSATASVCTGNWTALCKKSTDFRGELLEGESGDIFLQILSTIFPKNPHALPSCDNSTTVSLTHIPSENRVGVYCVPEPDKPQKCISSNRSIAIRYGSDFCNTKEYRGDSICDPNWDDMCYQSGTFDHSKNKIGSFSDVDKLSTFD